MFPAGSYVTIDTGKHQGTLGRISHEVSTGKWLVIEPKTRTKLGIFTQYVMTRAERPTPNITPAQRESMTRAAAEALLPGHKRAEYLTFMGYGDE